MNRPDRCQIDGHEFCAAPPYCPRCKWDAAVEADLAACEAGLIPDASLSPEQLARNAHGARTVLEAAPIDVRRLAAGERDED